jgi:hypothetical protein
VSHFNRVRALLSLGTELRAFRKLESETGRDLVELALDLAGTSISDRDFTKALADRSSGQKPDLESALDLLERFSFPFEISEHNRAWRALKAASEDLPMKDISESDRLRMANFDRFASLDRSIAFEELVVLEPRLRTLEYAATKSKGSPSPLINEIGDVEDLLEPLLGPESHQDDPILSSKIASFVAVMHLEVTAGLLEYDDDDDDNL